MNLEKILDQEIYLYENNFFKNGRMDEISLDEIFNHNFVLTPILKLLSYSLDFEFWDFENLDKFGKLFVGDENSEF